MTQPPMRKEPAPYLQKQGHTHYCTSLAHILGEHSENNEMHQEVNCEGMLACFKQTGSGLS